MVITKDTSIRELVFNFPASASYFMKYNIKCLVSGDARWGTIEYNALRKNYTQDDIQKFVDDLNALYLEREIL
jgi:hypothetical protein